ncbi:MAG TPA: MBL fold metallo-hydrolase [Rhodospirillaceae bacterium]|nr:MBL fold metallo-hydrolase [Rhodospirillaceae bacterium]
MNEHTMKVVDGLRFPFSEAPAPGTLIEVVPRLHWLRMPLPYALNHINLWVLDDGDGWTVVDTGLCTSETQGLWKQIFAVPLKDKPLLRVICTHFHPDHIGLAGWLAEKYQVPLWVTEKEIKAARTTFEQNEKVMTPILTEHYSRAGLNDAIAQAVATRGNSYSRRVHRLPENVIIIDPSKLIKAAGKRWRVIIGEGHSPELAALYSEDLGVLISGDQVLPGISPNVSVRPTEPGMNPLAKFLGTLLRFSALPEDTFVLPSHKLPFYGLQLRVEQLIKHHHERLDVARKACRLGASVSDVLKIMFERDFDAHQLHFALGETLAHLNFLVATGEIEMVSDGELDLYHTLATAA